MSTQPTRTNPSYDVIIVGAGITGVALGLALHQAHLRVKVLDHARPVPFTPSATFDTRIYAMSHASRQFLESVGGWSCMDAQRIQPISAMKVQGDRAGQLEFTRSAQHTQPLGYIAESGAMLHGLLQAVQRSAPHLIEAPVTVQSIATSAREATLTLNDGRTLTCHLVVAADGVNSALREQLVLSAHFKPYNHKAVVANYATTVAHQGVARQWFLHGEVLALLPLPGNHVSLVWSAKTEHGEALLSMGASERTTVLQATVGYGVGELTEVSQPAGFDLRLMKVSALSTTRAVLVGDAAHGVHPMAGQGLNLGLQDASVLASTIINRGEGPDCGDASVLRRYARARQEPILAMQTLTDGLYRLFGSTQWGLPWLRNVGMNRVDQLGWLKRQLVEQANQ